MADVHGNFEALERAMARHPDVALWLCAGDLASRSGAYPAPRAPLYWIKGNNEDFDRIAAWEAGAPQPPNLHLISNGTAAAVGSLRVAALGGTYAPRWFDTPAGALPHTPRDDKRRHFVREQAEACMQLGPVDVLMTHESLRLRLARADADVTTSRRAAGPVIRQMLAALRPRLHLCGHHHRFSEMVLDGVRSVCVDRISRSYLLVDARTCAYRLVRNDA